MRRARNRTAAAILCALALFAPACGSPGQPKDLAATATAERPQPANAGVATDVGGSGGTKVTCGDPTASLRPSGLDIPADSTMAKIRKNGQLRVGVDQNTFLFGFRNPTNSELEGFDIEIARAIAERLFGDPGKIQFKAITSQQRIPALENDEVDIVVRTMTINCERREQIEFSSVYFVAGQRVLVKKNSGHRGLDDFGGKKVCATKGSTSLRNIAEAKSKPIPVSVVNWSDCLVMMQQDQVEAISTDDTILAGMAQQDPTTEVVGERFTTEPYGIGIPKENKDMVRYVNAVLEKVRAGKWQSIYVRWIEPVLGKDSPPRPKYK